MLTGLKSVAEGSTSLAEAECIPKQPLPIINALARDERKHCLVSDRFNAGQFSVDINQTRATNGEHSIASGNAV